MNYIQGLLSTKRGREDDEDDQEQRKKTTTTSSSSKEKEVVVKCDEQGHLITTMGESLLPQYKLMKQLGEGTFGKVYRCWNRTTSKYVAIKVIKNIPKYRDAAKIEIAVLQAIVNEEKRTGVESHCITLREWFDYHGHICLVFDELGCSLYDFIKRNLYRGFPLPMVQKMGKQLLEAVQFLHKIQLIHTDLKPENILLQSADATQLADGAWVPVDPTICVIDFGSATFQYDHHTTVVSTRHYRAPEVVVEAGWSYPCDIWSIGCILFELMTGDAMFQTHRNSEHLALMNAILGPFDERFVSTATPYMRLKYFHSDCRLRWPDHCSKRSWGFVNGMKPLAEKLKKLSPKHAVVTDLLKKLLAYTPGDRLTCTQALEHEFFSIEF